MMPLSAKKIIFFYLFSVVKTTLTCAHNTTSTMGALQQSHFKCH